MAKQLLNFKVKTYFLKGELKIKTNPLIFLCQVITVWDEIQIEIVANGLRQSAVDCKGYGVIECVFDCSRPRANSTVTQTRSSQRERERVASAHNPSVPDFYEHRSTTELIKVEEHYLGNKIIKTDGSVWFWSPLAFKWARVLTLDNLASQKEITQTQLNNLTGVDSSCILRGQQSW